MNDRAAIRKLDEGQCIEVYATSGKHEGKLLGYAVFFSGAWDGWKANLGPGHKILSRVAYNHPGPERVIDVILEQQGFSPIDPNNQPKG